MTQIRKSFIIIVLLFFVFGMSSCGLFKGKNKCGDCPTWSKNDTTPNNKKAVNV